MLELVELFLDTVAFFDSRCDRCLFASRRSAPLKSVLRAHVATAQAPHAIGALLLVFTAWDASSLSGRLLWEHGTRLVVGGAKAIAVAAQGVTLLSPLRWAWPKRFFVSLLRVLLVRPCIIRIWFDPRLLELALPVEVTLESWRVNTYIKLATNAYPSQKSIMASLFRNLVG